MVLKPQDLVIALKVLTLGKEIWSQRSLAAALDLSLSEVNTGLKRGVAARLLIASENRKAGSKPNRHGLEEFIVHGVAYAFPSERGPLGRGVPTGVLGPDLRKEIDAKENEGPVWPYAKGNLRGYSLAPLYPSVPAAMLKPENEKLYRLLALVDAFREGRVRERRISERVLKAILKEKN